VVCADRAIHRRRPGGGWTRCGQGRPPLARRLCGVVALFHPTRRGGPSAHSRERDLGDCWWS